MLLLLFVSTLSNGQTTRTISLDYDTNSFNIDERNGVSYIYTASYPMVYKTDTLMPALPYLCINVLISPNESYVGISTTDDEILLEDSIIIARAPSYVISDYTDNYFQYTKSPVYEKNSYPENSVEYTGTQEKDGLKFLTFLICPFRYDVNHNRLFLKQHIKMQLSLYMDQNEKATIKRRVISEQKKLTLKNLVINKEYVDSLYDTFENSKERESFLPQDYEYKYLIITTDSLKEEFQRLANWKTIKGIKAKVLTVEEICAADTTVGRSIPLKIKYAIRRYHSPYDFLDYVLLGGNVQNVPSEECRIKIMMSGSLLSHQVQTDMFYACLTNMNWDTNNNGISGEVEDNINLMPDIVVTRLPASNRQEAQIMIDKELNYERSPEWSNNMLMCGVKTVCYLQQNGRVVSDEEYQMEQLYTDYLSNSWNGDVFRFYDTYTDYPDSSNHDITNTNLQYELEKGYSFVNVFTHGTSISWALENGSSYLYSQAKNMENQINSIIITGACSTNAYDIQPQALGSCFVRNPNNSVVGYYGTLRENISYIGYYFGPDKQYAGELYSKIFTYPQFGKAVYSSKTAFLANCYTNSSERWLHLSLSALCDPEMPAYHESPHVFSNISLRFINDSLYIMGDSLASTCLSSKYDYGNSYYYYDDGHNPLRYFSNLTNEYHLCFTRAGYIPSYAMIGNTVHVQNESIEGDFHVVANKVEMGRDVNESQEYGDVVICNGITKINSNSSILIKNGFEVRKGATLELKIEH